MEREGCTGMKMQAARRGATTFGIKTLETGKLGCVST